MLSVEPTNSEDVTGQERAQIGEGESLITSLDQNNQLTTAIKAVISKVKGPVQIIQYGIIARTR
jgi:hypothetical protein